MDKITTVLGKKMILIVAAMVTTVIIAGVVYGGGESQEDDTSATTNTTEEKTVPPEQKNDATYDSTYEVRGMKGMPENWPKDAPPAYPGAMLLTSYTHEYVTAGKPNPSVNYLTDKSGADITDYYVKGLNANEWKIEANADSPVGYRVITAKKDTRSFSAYISIVQTDGKTGVTSGVTF